MTANKHTPGPWGFYAEPQPNGCPVVGSKGLLVCMLGHSVHIADQKGTALANARLIAASPELLEALQIAYRHLEVSEMKISHCKDISAIQAAIAKATGSAA